MRRVFLAVVIAIVSAAGSASAEPLGVCLRIEYPGGGLGRAAAESCAFAVPAMPFMDAIRPDLAAMLSLVPIRPAPRAAEGEIEPVESLFSILPGLASLPVSRVAGPFDCSWIKSIPQDVPAPGARHADLLDEEIPLGLSDGISVFFCNPYFLRFYVRTDAETGLNTDTTEDISLGFTGDITPNITAAAFSTLSLMPVRRSGRQDRRQSESSLNRICLGCRFNVMDGIVLGLGAGAVAADGLRGAVPEFYFALRIRI